MCRANFFFILVLGLLAHVTIFVQNADSQASTPKYSSEELSLVISGKPLLEVEKSVKSFILSLSKSTSKPLTQSLEQTSLKGDKVKDLVTVCTKLVVDNVRYCCRNLGISKSINSRVIAPDNNETFTNNVIHNGLVVISEILDFILSGCDSGENFLFENQTVPYKFTNSNWKKPRYLDFIIITDELFIYLDCMTQDSLIEDITKAVDYGSKNSAKEVIDYLKKNIKKPRKSQKPSFSQSVCSAIENIKPGGYVKCISDWDKLQSCFESQTKPSKKNYRFSKYAKQVFPRKWVKSVVDLDRSCKLKKNQDFECKIRGIPRGTRGQVEYILKSLTGKSIKKRSSLSRVIGQLSKVISKNQIARSVVQNFCDYIAIYRQGEKRKGDLKKKSATNPKLLKGYRKVSKSLDQYKKGVTQDFFNAIVEFNQIPIYVEKSLRKATSKFFGWPFFSSLLKRLSVWFNSLFGDQSVSKKADEYQGISYDEKTQDLIEIWTEFPDFRKPISKEAALDNLLKSMNQVINENKALTRSSIFASGLNNVLLTLMFLETLSAVTGLMSCNIYNQYQHPTTVVSDPDRPNWTSTTSGTIGTSTSSEKPESDESEENPGSPEDSSEEEYRRHKSSFDLDSVTTFVADLPDNNILPLTSITTSRSKPLSNNTDYEDEINYSNDSNGDKMIRF